MRRVILISFLLLLCFGVLSLISCQSGITNEQRQDYLDLADYYDTKADAADKIAGEYFWDAHFVKEHTTGFPTAQAQYEYLLEQSEIYHDMAVEYRELAYKYRQLASQ